MNVRTDPNLPLMRAHKIVMTDLLTSTRSRTERGETKNGASNLKIQKNESSASEKMKTTNGDPGAVGVIQLQRVMTGDERQHY